MEVNLNTNKSENCNSASTRTQNTNMTTISIQECTEELNQTRKELRAKPDIWVRLIPVQTLIKIRFDVIIKSKDATLPKLIKLGKTLINFIKDLIAAGDNDLNDKDAQHFLIQFDELFQRILSIKESNKDDVDYEEFLDLVWAEHFEGNIDFSHVSVIENLLKASYRHLENVLKLAVSAKNPQLAHPVALMNPYNFQEFLHFFHQIYECNPDYYSFAKDFITTLPPSFSSSVNSIKFYPTSFHPLFFLISHLPPNPAKVSQPVLLEILNLTNELYETNDEDVHPFITFILLIHEKLHNCLKRASESGLITFSQFPYVWRMKFQEQMQEQE